MILTLGTAKSVVPPGLGIKVHLTESCDAELPHLITNVETTPATTADDAITPIIHRALQQRDLLPTVHLADTGFIDAELIVESNQRYQLDLLGPVRSDNHRQTREGRGFAAQDFVIDWASQQAICPAGCTSLSWTPAIDKQKNAVVKIKFSMRDCRPCLHRPHCTSAKRRTVTLRPQVQYEALQAARIRQTTPAFKQIYGQRAGIEGTLSQGVRRCDLRHTRYIGQRKTHLQHLATASAINLIRVAAWLDETPRAKTRYSAFERLYRLPPHPGASP